MGKRKKEMVRVMVERGGRLHKTIVKNTSKMFCVKYTVSVRFIYYTIKKQKQKTDNKLRRTGMLTTQYVLYHSP